MRLTTRSITSTGIKDNQSHTTQDHSMESNKIKEDLATFDIIEIDSTTGSIYKGELTVKYNISQKVLMT